MSLTTDARPGMNAVEREEARRGVVYGVLAYGLWGLIPLYFKIVADVPPSEVLAHRVLWSFVLLAGLITLVGRWDEVWPAMKSPTVLAMLAASTLLLALNWFTYIYAVLTNQVVEASLGYFLNPLVNVVIGVTLLGERLRSWQLASIVLAGLGVALLGAPPIAVTLALSFAFYGLLRKKVAVDGLLGLYIETTLLLPVAVAYVGYLTIVGRGALVSGDPWLVGRLAASGVVTAVPLLLFAAAARRLQFSTLGFLQYLAPSVQFLLAVFAFHEPLTTIKVAALSCIWAAVALYSFDSLRSFRDARSQLEPAPADL
jgi:chloramphenicol-sensitive protein RarD